jgi:glycosyltransferase involved in cell wall biosynthesis
MVVVIPASHEERTIVEVIWGLKPRGFTTLMVVDDGSSDRPGALAADEGVMRLRHLLNRGLGGFLG